MTVVVRPATAKDALHAVPLLLDAAEKILVTIFGDGKREEAHDFLHAAWLRGSGQYGFANHWVACIEDSIVGIVSCWHDKLPKHFDRDTMTSVTDYYGLDKAMDVVMRSQAMTYALHPPMMLELGVGHIAVAAGARRSGVGTALIRFMEHIARDLGKMSLVLDVEEGNRHALNFYEALGFVSQQTFSPFVKMAKGVPPL